MTSDEFATRFLQEEKVAVVPGTAFGDCGEGYLRISYAYSPVSYTHLSQMGALPGAVEAGEP